MALLASWLRVARKAQLPLVLVCAYVAGFIVTNSFLALRRPMVFDLLRGRYLSAALLVGFFAVVPAVIVPALVGIGLPAVWALWAALRQWTKTGRAFRTLPLRPIIQGALALGGLVLAPKVFSGLLAQPLSMGRDLPGLTVAFWWFALTGIAAFLGTHRWEDYSETTLLVFRVASAIASVIFLPLALVSLFYFGLFVFPAIEPQLGGGAGQAAMVSLTDGQLVDYAPQSARRGGAVGDSTAMFGIIVDEDDRYLVFGTCLRRQANARGYFQYVSVPRSRVNRITILGYSIPLDYDTFTELDLCEGPVKR